MTRAVSGLPYAGWVAEAIRGVKFRSERDRCAFLGAVLAASPAGAVLSAAEAVVPVPMFRTRQLDRGYNQAELIALSAMTVLGRDSVVLALEQREDRRSQIGLGAEERRTNIRGAFSVAEGVPLSRGRRIVVVDDVRTTGATLSACVEALRVLHPARVDVVTLAAELRPDVLAAIGMEG